MHECVIMRNRGLPSNLLETTPIQSGRQDVLHKIDIILDNSNLNSLLNFLKNQLDHIGCGKLDGKESEELDIYFKNVEIIIKKIINNKEFIIKLKELLLSDRYEEIREILEYTSKINPDILDETGIGLFLETIDQNNQEKINLKIKLTQAEQRETKLLELFKYLYKRRKLDNLSIEELEMLNGIEELYGESIIELKEEEKEPDLTRLFK